MEFEDWLKEINTDRITLREVWEASARAEREQCALVADLMYSHGPVKSGLVYCDDVAEAIRGRA